MRNSRLFFLGLGEALLSSTLLLDVDMNPIPSSHCAVAIQLRDSANQKPSVAPVGAANPRLGFEGVLSIAVPRATPGEQAAHLPRGKYERTTHLADGSAGRPKYASKCPLRYSTFPNASARQICCGIASVSWRSCRSLSWISRFDCSSSTRAFPHPLFKLIASSPNGSFRSFSRGTYNRNSNRAKNKRGEEALGLLPNRHRDRTEG